MKAWTRRSRALGVVALLVVGAACGGSDSSAGGVGPAAGGAKASGGNGGGTTTSDHGGATSGGVSCTRDAECAATAPATTPAGCALGTCDGASHRCRYAAPDADGDGHLDAGCVAKVAGSVTAGDDCDDHDKTVYPGAWDGPADGTTHPDACDMVDNDCDGTPDDGKLASGATCACAPDEVRSCASLADGTPIAWPGGAPVGACHTGNQTCGKDGAWGACENAVGPTNETCNGADDDCNGQIDDGVPGEQTWYLDGDGDGYASSLSGLTSCANPGTIATNGAYSNCLRDKTQPCPSQWVSSITTIDCDDGDATVHPGAWDGPLVGHGVDPADGFTASVFEASSPAAPADATVPAGAKVTLTNLHAVDFDWGPRGVFLPDGLSESAMPRVATTNDLVYFAARVTAPQAAGYTFAVDVAAGDGFALFVGGALVLDGWSAAPTSHDPVALDPTTARDLVLVYRHGTGDASVKLSWSGPGLLAPTVLTASPTNVTMPAADACDGKDTNCNGQVDDSTVSDGTYVARCQKLTSCVADAVQPCGEGTLCDNGVNACDPLTGTWDTDVCIGHPAACLCEPMTTVACWTGDPKAVLQDVEPASSCRRGTTTCGADGKFGDCQMEIFPQAETCDGKDNDCNGTVDDGAASTGAECTATAATGACRTGKEQCAGGKATCVASGAGVEQCPYAVHPGDPVNPPTDDPSTDRNCDGKASNCADMTEIDEWADSFGGMNCLPGFDDQPHVSATQPASNYTLVSRFLLWNHTFTGAVGVGLCTCRNQVGPGGPCTGVPWLAVGGTAAACGTPAAKTTYQYQLLGYAAANPFYGGTQLTQAAFARNCTIPSSDCTPPPPGLAVGDATGFAALCGNSSCDATCTPQAAYVVVP